MGPGKLARGIGGPSIQLELQKLESREVRSCKRIHPDIEILMSATCSIIKGCRSTCTVKVFGCSVPFRARRKVNESKPRYAEREKGPGSIPYFTVALYSPRTAVSKVLRVRISMAQQLRSTLRVV